MASVQPVSIKDDTDELLPNDFLTTLDKKSVFSLVFSAFQDEARLYHMSHMVERLNNEYESPAIMTASFGSLNDDKVSKFVNYPLRIFNPYKRAILAFDGKPQKISEFQKTVSAWKAELKDSGLEV
jgi:hypothetical protein